jgi:hypothetical protein
VRFLIALLALLAAAPAAAAGPDHVASSDVTLVQNVRQTGQSWGGGLHGDRLVVAGAGQLTVFDVAQPAAPALLGVAPLGNAGESDDVPGNGKWAAVAESNCLDAPHTACVAIFSVTGVPQRIASLPLHALSVACVLECRYLWATGDNTIIDMADPTAPKVVGEFLDLQDEDVEAGCYSTREMRPGVVMAACDPALVISTRPEHGGSERRPVVIAQADTENFQSTAPLGGVPHGARWPGARDRFLMTTTETPFSGTCGGDDLGAFVLWDARPVLEGGGRFRAMATWRPANGTYLDGRSPYNAVGCSPHFIAEHPSFRDGGLVAVAALENGVRFLRITPEGRIEEHGFFLGLGGTAALPIWHPDGRVLYVVDYARGLDVLTYTGETFASPAPPAAAPAPAPRPASPAAPRRFRLLGVIRNARERATIAVETPGPGRLVATPRARGMRLRRLVADVRSAGLATFTVVAPRKALRGRRRLRVDVRIAWRPSSGAPRSARERLVLRAGR